MKDKINSILIDQMNKRLKTYVNGYAYSVFDFKQALERGCGVIDVYKDLEVLTKKESRNLYNTFLETLKASKQ